MEDTVAVVGINDVVTGVDVAGTGYDVVTGVAVVGTGITLSKKTAALGGSGGAI